jgi:hypothetical protein
VESGRPRSRGVPLGKGDYEGSAANPAGLA